MKNIFQLVFHFGPFCHPYTQGIVMQKVRIGLIGTGYIGRCHAIAYSQASTVFKLKGELVREMVAEVNPDVARAQAAALGFNRSTGDRRELVADEERESGG